MEDKESCVSAGINLSKMLSSAKDYISGFRTNFVGLVPERELKIPYSELSIHTRTSGKDIIAIGCPIRNNYLTYCGVVYSDNGKCGYVEGKPSEVLSYGLRKLLEERLKKVV